MAGEGVDVNTLSVPIVGTFDHEGVLFTFEGDTSKSVSDKLIADKSQTPMVIGEVTVIADPNQAANGDCYALFPNAPSEPTVLEIPDTSNLGKAFTLAATIEESGSSPYSRLFSAFDGGHPGANELIFDFDDTGTQPGIKGLHAFIHGTSIEREATFDDDQYHHLAITYRDGKVRLYLDGQQLGDEAVVPSGTVNLLYNLRFGEDHGETPQTNEPFEGRADDILVYRRPLSPLQMATLATDGAESFFAGPHGTHLTAEGDTTSATDSIARDGLQNGKLNNNVDVDTYEANARAGNSSFKFTADPSALSTIELADTSYLGKKFTLAAFVKANENKFMRIFSSYDGEGLVNDDEIVFDFKPDGSVANGIRFVIGSSVLMPDTPVSFSLDEYHHLAVTYDDGKATLFLDGVVVAKSDFGTDAIDLASNLFVGEDHGGPINEQFIGHIDNILVLYDALSPSDIDMLANPNTTPGDANRDGKVDNTDAMILAANWQGTGKSWREGDFNGDGKIDEVDATLLATNWQQIPSSNVSVPEPGTIKLLMNVISVFLIFYKQKATINK